MKPSITIYDQIVQPYHIYSRTDNYVISARTGMEKTNGRAGCYKTPDLLGHYLLQIEEQLGVNIKSSEIFIPKKDYAIDHIDEEGDSIAVPLGINNSLKVNDTYINQLQIWNLYRFNASTRHRSSGSFLMITLE